MPSLLNHKRILLLFVVLLAVLPTVAQYHYLLFFKDKKPNLHSISQPEKFLSQRCLANRSRWNIPVTTADLPLSSLYTDSVMALPVSFRYGIKWMNMLHISSETDIDVALQRFSFIEKIEKVYLPTRKNKQGQAAKYSTTGCLVADSLAYARSYNQTEMIHLQSLHQKGYDGDGMLIAVMDVGYADAPNNPMLRKLFDRGGVQVTWDWVDNEEDVYNNSSHGLLCLSAIAANESGRMIGTAPDADFLLYCTEDDNSETILEEYHWAAAAEQAENLGATVFSTSLGYTTFDSAYRAYDHTPAQLDGHTTVIAKAANRAASLGVLVVNAAGNSGASDWRYISTPADADSCIAVGAVDREGGIAAFSSRGIPMHQTIKPNVCAKGKLATVVDSWGNIIEGNGTSFATPILAGAAACLWQANPTKSNMEVKKAIEESSSHFFNPNLDYGYGIPNFMTAHQLLNGQINLTINPKEERLFIYQNPTQGALTFSVYGKSDRSLRLKIVNLQGQVMVQEDFCLRKEEYKYFSYDEMEQFSAGVYVLGLFENGKKIETLKLIKY